MELRRQVSPKDWSGLLTTVSLVAFTLLPGCVATVPFINKDDAPETAVCQVVPIWDPRVAFAPDPVHGGAMRPGILGRLYLFGPLIDFPMMGDGSVTVDLYQEKAPNSKELALLEEWRIDAVTLKRLLKKDMIGWGYTLFLPWGTYHSEPTSFQIQLRYEPAKGAPIYAPPSPLILDPVSNAPASPAASAPTVGKSTNASGPGPVTMSQAAPGAQ